MSECISLLPPNSTATERATECAVARMADLPVPLRSLWDPATCPAELLPWLAWAWSVDTWSDSWTIEQKRHVVASAYDVHRVKGTRHALQRALNSLGYGVTLVEWFEDSEPADPYTFRLIARVDQTPLPNLAVYRSIVEVALATKNVRSHLASLALEGHTEAPLFAGALYSIGETITLSAEAQ